MELSDWLRVNLSRSGAFARSMEHWDLVFGYTLWNLWLRRTVIVFNVLSAAQGIVIERAYVMVTNTIGSSVLPRASPVTGARLVADSECRVPPEVDWIKVNSDGEHNPVNGYAMCGGVVGFSRFLGTVQLLMRSYGGVLWLELCLGHGLLPDYP
ncbi:hypothetical protein V6N11_021531 [Hibiscus sabdariffa]|uniref:RNase H type-1 domain-containing protein n=2 Tax=Hibiscus sabdariffa TaxID=183260 RepID=A0ABR2NHV0_9ROSI